MRWAKSAEIMLLDLVHFCEDMGTGECSIRQANWNEPAVCANKLFTPAIFAIPFSLIKIYPTNGVLVS